MAKLQPFVWLYCQNTRVNMTGLLPLVKGGGEMVHLDNVGREGHSYLQHITRHWEDLADHTLFTQDIPDARLMPLRFEVGVALPTPPPPSSPLYSSPRLIDQQ